MLDQLKKEGCELCCRGPRGTSSSFSRAKHKCRKVRHQIWQEGSFPKEIDTDEMMASSKIRVRIHNNPVRDAGWI